MDTQPKVYTYETISDANFPSQPDSLTAAVNLNAPTANTPGTASTIPAQAFPVQQVAVDLISTAMNTKTKKIIQEFQFAPSGALQVGDFESGVSGDVRIDGNGIVARNKLGDTTVAIDGDTGDAIFAGELRSGSTVTGDVQILEGGHILMYDANGIPSIFIGDLA